jgi:type III secretion system FlhB-like substrate exporter
VFAEKGARLLNVLGLAVGNLEYHEEVNSAPSCTASGTTRVETAAKKSSRNRIKYKESKKPLMNRNRLKYDLSPRSYSYVYIVYSFGTGFLLTVMSTT